jgi:steroid delta-isomerase-like uncharacterized protein
MRTYNPLFLLLVLSPFLLTQCTAAKKLKMAEQNRETIRLWFEEGWNHNRNEELLLHTFCEDWEDGNPLQADQRIGLDGMRQLIASYRKAFPDAQFTITHLFADHKHAAIRYEVTATHHGEMFGLQPTGKQFFSTGVVLYDMEDGKIKRSWQELDLEGIIQQLKE